MRSAPTALVHVCALRHVPAMMEQTGARHLISAIDGDLQPVTPKGLAAERHLRLDMHDVVEAAPGATLPASEHVLRLVEFVTGWDRLEPMLIHCFAGLSRSTATAFITL